MWPSLAPVVQLVLNNTLLRRLGNRCPLMVFISLPFDSSLTYIKTKLHDNVEVVKIYETRARQLLTVERMQLSMETVHKEVAESVSRSPDKIIEAHNARTHVRSCNFGDGDYVLRGVLQRNKDRKISLRWHGPSRVTKVFGFPLRGGRYFVRGEGHYIWNASKLFRNSDFTVTEECKEYISFQKGEYCVVEFQDIRLRKGKVELLVKWKQFSDEESALESFETMREDVPKLVEEFLQELKSAGTKRQKRIAATW